MNKATSTQQELRFGLPCLWRDSNSPSASRVSDRYRKKRNAILKDYPDQLASLLDSDFDESYLQAGKLCISKGSSILDAGDYAIDRLERADTLLRESKVDVAFRPSKVRAESKILAATCEEILFTNSCMSSAYAAMRAFAKRTGTCLFSGDLQCG